MRQSLFNILGVAVEEARFLDLYAGTGSVGLEALSRGAAEVLFVEKHPKVVAVLRRNLEKMAAEELESGTVEIQRDDAIAACEELEAMKKKFDLIFVDPPFAIDFEPLWNAVKPLLNEGGRALIQYPIRKPPSYASLAQDQRRYGESGLLILQV